MKLIKDKIPYKIVADNNKKIKSKNDNYKETYTDENGNKVEEHFPTYSKVVYVPSLFTEEMMNNLYEEIDE